jgi:hypothetical protein
MLCTASLMTNGVSRLWRSFAAVRTACGVVDSETEAELVRARRRVGGRRLRGGEHGVFAARPEANEHDEDKGLVERTAQTAGGVMWHRRLNPGRCVSAVAGG